MRLIAATATVFVAGCFGDSAPPIAEVSALRNEVTELRETIRNLRGEPGPMGPRGERGPAGAPGGVALLLRDASTDEDLGYFVAPWISFNPSLGKLVNWTPRDVVYYQNADCTGQAYTDINVKPSGSSAAPFTSPDGQLYEARGIGSVRPMSYTEFGADGSWSCTDDDLTDQYRILWKLHPMGQRITPRNPAHLRILTGR